MSLHHKATEHEKLYQPPNYLNHKNSILKNKMPAPQLRAVGKHKKNSLFHRLKHHAKISFTLSMGALGLLALMPPVQGNASIPFKNIKKKIVQSEDNSDDMWKEIADDFTLSGYTDNPAVQQQIRWYQQHPKSLTDVTEQAAPYLYYVHQQVKAKGLPGELVLLPIIESTYNPFAYSNVGAAGLWQLMPKTASYLGLKQNSGFDGRRDVMSSTQAALGYLNYLDNMFDNNWLLALAAYNAGPGTVLNADKGNKGDHSDTKFWSLHLPEQTKQYVPRLLAIAAIIRDPGKYGINLPSLPNKPYFAKVDVNTPIALSKVAKLSDMSVDEVHNLNPGIKQTTQATSNAPTHVLIPIEKVQTFKENMDAQGKTVKVQMPAPVEAEATTTKADPNPVKTDSTPATVKDTAPAPTDAPATTPAKANDNNVVTYKVEKGDTLSKTVYDDADGDSFYYAKGAT
ncbi:MAG: transglycosylase SLT domain-containing protein, partial [Gammaproteobacteria bacterium]|nr:transglycosylase SLT domain-containing protein [Gammaproteobacteria bacterium]